MCAIVIEESVIVPNAFPAVLSEAGVLDMKKAV